MQAELNAPEKVPAEHPRQTELDGVEKVPSGHTEQAVAPSLEEYVPSLHSGHMPAASIDE